MSQKFKVSAEFPPLSDHGYFLDNNKCYEGQAYACPENDDKDGFRPYFYQDTHNVPADRVAIFGKVMFILA